MKYNRIKILLVEHEVSNKELAESLKITRQTVSFWCTNHAQPSIKKLYEIAAFLNVDVRELLVPSKDIKKL